MTEQSEREYLREWSAGVATAVTEGELRSLVEHYRSIERNPKLDDEDRAVARRRAQWLVRHLPGDST